MPHPRRVSVFPVRVGSGKAAFHCQRLLDFLTDNPAFSTKAARLQFRLNGLDDRADFLGSRFLAGGGGDFSNCLRYQSVKAGLIEGLGQKLLNDHNLSSFNGREFRPIALAELLNGVAALFDHGGQRLLFLGWRERLTLFNSLVLERVLDEAQRAGAHRVVRLHGGDGLLRDDGFQCACVGHAIPFGLFANGQSPGVIVTILGDRLQNRASLKARKPSRNTPTA